VENHGFLQIREKERSIFTQGRQILAKAIH
jgi:hypothetical protein